VSVIFTLEEHSAICGLWNPVAEVIAEARFSVLKRFRRLVIPDMFLDKYGSQASLMECYGLTSGRLAAVIQELRSD